MDDDGDFDASDQGIFDLVSPAFDDTPWATVGHAFSAKDNPLMFQGRPHFALDTVATATEGKLMLNDHRLRMMDVAIGRWLTRDPIGYLAGTMNLYQGLLSNPLLWLDPLGLCSEELQDMIDRMGKRLNDKNNLVRSVQKSLKEAYQLLQNTRNVLDRAKAPPVDHLPPLLKCIRWCLNARFGGSAIIGPNQVGPEVRIDRSNSEQVRQARDQIQTARAILQDARESLSQVVAAAARAAQRLKELEEQCQQEDLNETRPNRGARLTECGGVEEGPFLE